MDDQKIMKLLQKGSIGVMPTDTIYGLVGTALSESVVQRIYGVRGRDGDKPLIVLVADFSAIGLFDITLDPIQKSILSDLWRPRQKRKTSVILPCAQKKWAYLHRGTNSIAFRLVHNKHIVQIIRTVGPLVAPSANPQGKKPAQTIRQARVYFGESVDFYKSEGHRLVAPVSRIVQLRANGDIYTVRP